MSSTAFGMLAFDVLVHVSACRGSLEPPALSPASLAREEPVRIDRAVTRDRHFPSQCPGDIPYLTSLEKDRLWDDI
jgi:hypothetical protein